METVFPALLTGVGHEPVHHFIPDSVGCFGADLHHHNPQAAQLAANARDPHLPARDSILCAVGKQQARIGRRAPVRSRNVLAG